jgi:hypothetical protein
VNQFERYALESNSENSRHTTLQARRPGLFRLVDRFRRKRRNVVAYPHILRIGAEALQLRIGPAPQYLFDDCLERTFIAKVPGAEVSVEGYSWALRAGRALRQECWLVHFGNPGRSTVRKTSNRPMVGTPGPLAVSRLVQKDSRTTPVRQLNRLFTINFRQMHRRFFHPAAIR